MRTVIRVPNWAVLMNSTGSGMPPLYGRARNAHEVVDRELFAAGGGCDIRSFESGGCLCSCAAKGLASPTRAG
ncbi:hypothetical protein DC31_11175 [Microbacterium sp. CH12i]|nr:hypothetical protein DC31_11175 [Microbacterium sp. CH12i]